MKVSPPSAESSSRFKEFMDSELHAELPPELTHEEKIKVATDQWAGDAKLEAMETILGERVDARDLSSDPDLANLYLINDAGIAVVGLSHIQAQRAAAEQFDV